MADRRIRLDKLLSHMGFGSRSEIKKAVKAGAVAINGKREKDSGRIVDYAADEIVWEGELVRYKPVVYFMLNKPQGVISATEDQRDRTVIDLLRPEDRLMSPFPVGRLDKDTEGLLLLTNDGQLAHGLLSPRKHVPKTYEALVVGQEAVGERDQQQFAAGVTLDDGYCTMPAQLHILGSEPAEGGYRSRILLTIHEGKFHQVKRMFVAVGKKVTALRRIRMGTLELDPTLALGSYRELTSAELDRLLEETKG